MTKYKKKPMPVDAVQWFKDGDHPQVKGIPSDHSLRDASGGNIWKKYGFIETLEGGHVVTPGDYIVGPGVRGEYWPVKADIFEKTYEQI
jgi:hypothetical protein